MGGAIIQLVVYGSQNIYLTGDPQITYWKSVYKRYTNFAQESIEQDITGSLTPGNNVSVTIGRNGDLLNGIYLQYNPQEIYNENEVLFVNGGIPTNLGNTLFKQLDLEIGGNLIDRHYGKWLTIWSDLTSSSYISPSPPLDTFLQFGATGVEPAVSSLYDRMTFNHNQQNSQFDLNLATDGLYNSSYNTYWTNLTLIYYVNSGVQMPATTDSSNTFDLIINNVNNLENFSNTSPGYFFLSSYLGYVVRYSTVNTSSGVTTFTGCTRVFPDGTSVYVSIGDTLSPVYTFTNPPLLPEYNILPNNNTTTFTLDIDNLIQNNYYVENNVFTIQVGNSKYKITHNVVNNDYYGDKIFNCRIVGPYPPAPINLSTTPNCYIYFPNVQSITTPLNIIPTSGTFDLLLINSINVFSGAQKVLQPNGIFSVTIDGVIYYMVYENFPQPYNVFDGFSFLFNKVTPLNYPPQPLSIPNSTNLLFTYYSYTLENAPSEAYIPLKFWFCKNPGMAIPLIALQYHEVKLVLQLATYQELHASNYTDVNLTSIKVFAEFIYLDSTERKKFANDAHEYLIEQLQYDNFGNSFTNSISGGLLQVNLNFNNCVKEIIFCGTPISGYNTQGIATANTLLNTPCETTNVNLQLIFNQVPRFSPRNIKYFTRNQIWDCHTGSGSSNASIGSTGTDNIGIYSFALRPEEHQPSGTCNFSRMTNPQFVFSNFGTTEQLNALDLYAVSYNILRIMSGVGNIVFAN